jgi:hypothetical protein
MGRHMGHQIQDKHQGTQVEDKLLGRLLGKLLGKLGKLVVVEGQLGIPQDRIDASQALTLSAKLTETEWTHRQS